MKLSEKILQLCADSPAGLHSAAVALELGLKDAAAMKTLWRMVHRTGVLNSIRDPVKGASSRSRYYLPQHEALALEAVGVVEKPAPVAKERTPAQKILLGILRAHPKGLYSAEAAQLAGMDAPVAAKSIDKLRAAGMVGSYLEPCQIATRRMRWFAIEHREAAHKEHVKRHAAKFCAGPSRKKAPDPVFVPPAPKVQPRIDVPPPPLFSGLGIGRYADADTWASRVYA
jgi:hypothetical protein